MADNNPNVILRKKAYEPGTDSTSGVITFDTNGKKIYLDNDVYGEQNVQADWNQTVGTAPDYIKNRTHWKEDSVQDNDAMVESYQRFLGTANSVKRIRLKGADDWQGDVPFMKPATGYVFVVNGREFEVSGVDYYNEEVHIFGDTILRDIYDGEESSSYAVSGMVCFEWWYQSENGYYYDIYVPAADFPDSSITSFTVRVINTAYHKLDAKYVPISGAYNEDSGNWTEITIGSDTHGIPSGGGGDWSQNDSAEMDYIKNRTHWKEETEKSSFLSATVMMAGSEDGCSYMSSSDPLSQLKEGSAYTFDVYFPYDDDEEGYQVHKRYVGVKSADASETVGVNGVAWYDASGFGYIRGDMNGDGETETFAISIIDNEFASYFQQGGEALIEVSEFFLDTDLYTLSQLSQQQGSGVDTFTVNTNAISITLTESYGIGLFSDGNAYKLKVGTNEYIGTASNATAYTGAPSWFIGNPSIFGGQDNGEAFSVVSEDATSYPGAPFTKALIIKIPSSGADYTSSTGSTAISLYLGRHYLYHKLDNGYLDLSDVAFSGRYSDLSGKPESVTDFPDVVISTLTDGDVLKYNSGTGKWENGIGSGGTSIQVRVWSSDGN